MTEPAERVTLVLRFKGSNNSVVVHEETRTHDANGPFEIRDTVAVQNLCDNIDSLVFELRREGQALMNAGIPVSFSNAGTCASKAGSEARIRSRAGLTVSRKIYAINGAYIGEAGEHNACQLSITGVFLSVDEKRRCTRVVAVAP